MMPNLACGSRFLCHDDGDGGDDDNGDGGEHSDGDAGITFYNFQESAVGMVRMIPNFGPKYGPQLGLIFSLSVLNLA